MKGRSEVNEYPLFCLNLSFLVQPKCLNNSSVHPFGHHAVSYSQTEGSDRLGSWDMDLIEPYGASYSLSRGLNLDP